MRKILVLIIAFLLTLTLIGCNSTTTTKKSIITISKTNAQSSTGLSTTVTNIEVPTTVTSITTALTRTEVNTTTTIKKGATPITSLTPTSNSEELLKYYENFDLDTYITYLKDDLIEEIYNLISVAKITISYTNTRDYFNYTDENPDTGKCELFYSHLQIGSFETQSGTYNREHVWPQALGESKDEPGGKDLHHIRPCLERVNSDRGNKLYGNVDHDKASKSIYQGSTYGYYTSNVFEPLDDVKGDVARICFYYAIKYDYDLAIITSDKTFKTFLEWNKMDPVSKTEINRNSYVQSLQGNRNIFIDNPELANYIWG